MPVNSAHVAVCNLLCCWQELASQWLGSHQSQQCLVLQTNKCHLLRLQRYVSHAALRTAILLAFACRRIQAHASSCSESGVAGGTIRQSFCSALQAELAEFYHLMAVLQEQSLREAPKPDNIASGDSRLDGQLRHTPAISLPSNMSTKLVSHVREAVQLLLKAKPYEA